MKYEILIKILFDLLNYKKITAPSVALKYGVSVRTVYRYIQSLEYSGVPIYTEQGRNGGICIMDTFKLSSSYFTVKEHESVVSALSAINKELPNSNLLSALEKLQNTNKLQKNSLTLSSGNLIIDAGPWGDAVGYRAKLEVIEKCIENANLLEITYHDRAAEITTRVIEPHTVIFKQGLWYIYAFCRLRNEFRLFKTGRIEYAKILDDKFTRREIGDTKQLYDTWYNSLDSIMVTFSVEKSILSDIEDWLGIENISYNDDRILATAKLPDDISTISKILSFGFGLKVVSPLSLKEKIIDNAKKLIESYN